METSVDYSTHVQPMCLAKTDPNQQNPKMPNKLYNKTRNGKPAWIIG
jgi:hypothetical protein